ncbi:MAG: Ion transport protein-domain-containing protein [Monoraphidium minutum]|nr:MAG: Ion transport protein-domain-containing protein [Monoraphidium minutum]
MESQQAQCVRAVVDALVAGHFSRASAMVHLYDALQGLVHDSQHRRLCRRLLKHLPMVDTGEVEVDSALTRHARAIYKCSTHGNPARLWGSVASTQQPLLEALDVLIKRASWRDSIVALLMLPAVMGLRQLGAGWMWVTRRQMRTKDRVLVSASSKLIPVRDAAKIRPGRTNLLRQLVSANTDADLYGRQLVRAVIEVKWDSFARAFLLMQASFVHFLVFMVLFLVYLAFAVYYNDPAWTTAQMVRQPAGQAAVVLECILVVMMCGQAADELKQMVTYKREYFNSPWNYMDVASCAIIAALFLLHVTRLNHQAFVVLVALEVLLLCLRMLYFCMAYEHFGALLRMVLIVIKDMRYFFVLLVFMLCSFGLTFSVLLSTPSDSKRIPILAVKAVGNGTTLVEEEEAFGSFEDSILQLFTLMMGDLSYDTLKSIMRLNTVAARLAVTLAAGYGVLVLIVLVNLLIAIVDETYGVVKESEADQILRNKALIIDEIESTLTDKCIQDLNSRVLLPYVHILVPQQASASRRARSGQQQVADKLRKLKDMVRGLEARGASGGGGGGGAGALQPWGAAGPGGGGGGGGGVPAAHAAAPACAAAAAAAAPAGGDAGGGGAASAAAAAAAAAVAAELDKRDAQAERDAAAVASGVRELGVKVDGLAGAVMAAADVGSRVEALQAEVQALRRLLLGVAEAQAAAAAAAQQAVAAAGAAAAAAAAVQAAAAQPPKQQQPTSPQQQAPPQQQQHHHHQGPASAPPSVTLGTLLRGSLGAGTSGGASGGGASSGRESAAGHPAPPQLQRQPQPHSHSSQHSVFAALFGGASRSSLGEGSGSGPVGGGAELSPTSPHGRRLTVDGFCGGGGEPRRRTSVSGGSATSGGFLSGVWRAGSAGHGGGGAGEDVGGAAPPGGAAAARGGGRGGSADGAGDGRP